jgi:hypothetical protein
MTAATAATVPAAVRPHLRRDAITALARAEAVRALRGPTFWISLAITAWGAWETRSLDWHSGSYSSFLLAFTPLAAGIFVVGVLAGGRDRRRADRAPLAAEAALDVTDRTIARLLGLGPLVLIGAVIVIGAAIGSRIEGGFWIGNPPGRTDTAVHGVAEILLPVLIFVVGACTGVAAGRAFRHRTPVIVIGLLVWFLFFGAYWALQWAPAGYLVPTQIQPIWVTIDGNATDASRLPANWLLDRPDEPGGEWTRVVVHDPLTAWHDLYLVGVAVLATGLAIRSRTGRRLALIGVAVIGIGLVGQVAATPHGASDLEVPM